MPKQPTSITLDESIYKSLEHQSQKTGLPISQLISLTLKGYVIHNRILLDTEIMIEKFAVNIQGYYVKITHNSFDGYEASWMGLCQFCHKSKSFLAKEKTFETLFENVKALFDYHDCDDEEVKP